MKISIAQISPVWLDKDKTIAKAIDYISRAATSQCDLVCFGETLLPGYPFWVELTDGAKFESQRQKEIYAHYLSQGIDIDEGDLNSICKACKDGNIATYIGCAEKASDRGGHSIYCSLVYIDKSGTIQSVHRKLMPTYEERLVWAIGDGNGLVSHKLEEFTVGGLNCWENWMPLPRAALYAQGVNLHVSVWPGNLRNTIDLTRHIAIESRSYVISACSVFNKNDIPDDIPHASIIKDNANEWLADGGSCLSGPDGKWIIEPVTQKEELLIADIDIKKVYEERHNFDPSGHYSRPDVIKLNINRDRQGVIDQN